MDWRPLAVTIRSHQVDSLAATPVASVVEIGCRPAARTQHVRINGPVPTPGGTVGKGKRSGAECGNRTRLICLEGRGPMPLDQPRSHEGFVCRFTAPRLHATDR